MIYKNKIQKDMNEILHGNLADTARKHFGRISDTWDDRKKEKALADVYDNLDKELSKSKKTEDTDKIRLENELSRIRREDTDKLLKERKLYNPSMSNSDKQMTLGAVYDRIQKELEGKEDVTLKRPWEISKPKMPEREKSLGYMYDRLNEERDKIVKNNSLADKTKTEPEEMVSFALKPKDNSRFKNTPDSSVLYRNILPSEMQNFISLDESKAPEKSSYRNNDKITEIESDMNDFKSTTDMDYLIDNYAEKYGVDYDEGYVSGKYKEQVVKDILSSMEYEHKIASGIDVKPQRPSAAVSEVEEKKSSTEVTAELDDAIKNMQILTIPANEKMEDAYFKQQVFDSSDRDWFLENHQQRYGYEYFSDMSEAEKNDLYKYVKSRVEEESNIAQGEAKKVWDENQAVNWITKNVYGKQNGNADINFTYNTLLEQQAYAWAEYLNTGSEKDREVANLWDLAEEKFLIDNEVGEGNLFTNTIASAAPGIINNVKAGAETALISGAGGFVLSGPAGAIPMAKYGFAAGTAMDIGVKNSGVAYKALLASGIPADIAVTAAKIDGVSSAISKFVSACATKNITGKMPDKVIASITDKVAGKLGKDVAKEIGDKLSELYVQYKMGE